MSNPNPNMDPSADPNQRYGQQQTDPNQQQMDPDQRQQQY
jgi:hypothetical protein